MMRRSGKRCAIVSRCTGDMRSAETSRMGQRPRISCMRRKVAAAAGSLRGCVTE